MYKTGVYFGKFLPPHRGHLNAIIHASTKCEKLYVIVNDNRAATLRKSMTANLPFMELNIRVQWLSQELQNIDHIKVIGLDESRIPEYPNGWDQWAELMRDAVPVNIDAFFVGENEYEDKLKSYFPKSSIEVFDSNRSRYPISATMIRTNPMQYWDYILGSARPFFAKKVLIIGTESCGKTTLVKYLAKIFNTSWSEEVGRDYAMKYLGGNEAIFTDIDFMRIAHLQYEQDYQAMRSANKVCFFDTDATITQYYCELYMGKPNEKVESYIDNKKYDMIFMMKPDVKWVDDGQRLNGDQQKREELHNTLRNMYIKRGFKNIIEVGGNYTERLDTVISYLDKMF